MEVDGQQQQQQQPLQQQQRLAALDIEVRLPAADQMIIPQITLNVPLLLAPLQHNRPTSPTTRATPSSTACCT
jgi:hypothetical protein